MAKPCDNSCKKLSKNLLLMKFMKRTAVKTELEEIGDEKKRIENEEHWELDVPELTKEEDRYIMEQSFSVLQNLQYGRFSFKGFNSEIERIMRTENTSLDLDESERREKEIAVSDDEMSERYKWLVSNMGKKFLTKRQRAAMESDSDDDDDETTNSVPNAKQKDSHSQSQSSNVNSEKNGHLNEMQQKGNRKLYKKHPNKVTKLIPGASIQMNDQFRLDAKAESTSKVYNPQPKGEKRAPQKHTGPVMDSDEEDDDGTTRRKRRKRGFIKPKDDEKL